MSQDEDEDDAVLQLWGLGQAEPPKLVVNNSTPPYVALDTQDRLLGFTLHCHSVKLAYTFFYPHLLSITIHEPEGDFVVVTTSTSIIRIYGHNLQPIVSALNSHTCKALWEFSKELYLPPPGDDGKPFIEKIDVALIKGGESMKQRV
ncbi:MAG TPA: hypothetical protein VN039_07010, partial [Nitrospira sp.]|nr:hypothetical protein [Nitrospira sp.]